MKNILENCLLFKNVCLEEINIKYKILEFHKNENIENILDKNKFVGIILNGEISVNKLFIDGRNIKITSLYPSDLFGICNLFCDENMPSILTSKSKTRVLCIDKNEMLSLFSKNEILFHNYSFICNKKILFLNEKIEFYNISSAQKKFIYYILKNCKNNIVYNTFKKCELADFLSISRSSLYREINKLIDLKYISIDKNNIKILQRQDLTKLLKI